KQASGMNFSNKVLKGNSKLSRPHTPKLGIQILIRQVHIFMLLLIIDSNKTYPYATDNYSAPRRYAAAYGKFQHDDLGRTYGRY
ncbi:hypothetical protein CFC21_112234, partial [Triticum aestivum]|nr:hypothetical protein [Triticum aestivum]